MTGGYPYDRTKSPVTDSPVGPGRVTDVSHAGYPEVNGVAVAWLAQADGHVFDPDGVRPRAPTLPEEDDVPRP